MKLKKSFLKENLKKEQYLFKRKENLITMKTRTKKDYENFLNEIGKSLSEDEFIIAGKQRTGKYGSLIRKHDPIAFEVGFIEWNLKKR